VASPTWIAGETAPRLEERSTMEAKPSKPGVPGIDHEERHSLTGSLDKSPITTHTQQTSTEPEEDWLSLATGDPAFWLKEPDRD